MGAISYYLEKPIYQEAIFEDYTFKNKLKNLKSLQQFLQKNGITHILMDMAFIKRYLIPTLDKEKFANFQKFLQTKTKLIVHYHNWYLFQLHF